MLVSKKSFEIFIIVWISLVVFSFRVANAQDEKAERQRPERVIGKIEKVETNSMKVRVGDATKTFSFDNKTVFTYGDQKGKARDLKAGDEVFATVEQGKAAEVHGTQSLEGIIEKVDAVKKELVLKVGDQIKKIPFRYFQAFSSDGQTAAFTDMNVGDSVLLNVNMGFADQPDAGEKP
jgi:hypothetical protein